MHSMHENVRLCVECNRQSWSCPVKRLWFSVSERARAMISGAPAEPSGLERQYRALQWSRAGPKMKTSASALFSSSKAKQFRVPWQSCANSSGHLERCSGAEWGRETMSNAPMESSPLEVRNVGRCFVFDRPGRRISLCIMSFHYRPTVKNTFGPRACHGLSTG